MTQEEDYIIFEEVNNKNMDKNAGQIAKHPILGHYNSLYEELLKKCDPACFLEPYDRERVDLANDIYKQVQKNKNNNKILKELRTKAICELGVKFSTIQLYELLTKACNPKRFTGNNYDSDKLAKANELYSLVLLHADNIESLEKIETMAKDFIKIIAEEQIILDEKRKKEDELFTRILGGILIGFIILVIILFFIQHV